MIYTELKTYKYLYEKYFLTDLSLEHFAGNAVIEYNDLIESNDGLKIILGRMCKLERKLRHRADKLFKEIVQDDFTYIENFLNAIYRIYAKKLDSRLFKIYKNKETKEYFRYNLYYKDTEIKNIDSLEVIQFFIDNFKLDFGNLGSAGFFINNQLKYCKYIRLERLI